MNVALVALCHLWTAISSLRQGSINWQLFWCPLKTFLKLLENYQQKITWRNQFPMKAHVVQSKFTTYKSLSSHWRCSIKKDVLKNFVKFTRKRLCRSLFYLENRLRHRCFPMGFAKFSRTTTVFCKTTAKTSFHKSPLLLPVLPNTEGNTQLVLMFSAAEM